VQGKIADDWMLRGRLQKENIFHFIKPLPLLKALYSAGQNCRLWDAAWRLKKRKYFSFYKTEAFAQGTI
jgi:hypothetical protein